MQRLREIPGFISVKETSGRDGYPDLLIEMNERMIMSHAIPAIEDMLRKIHIYKTINDTLKAKDLFHYYCFVSDKDKEYRHINLLRDVRPRLEAYGYFYED